MLNKKGNSIIRKACAFFLLFLFMLPILVKATHHLYIPHEHDCHTEHTRENRINEEYEKCPVCEYQIAEITEEKYTIEFLKKGFTTSTCIYKQEIVLVSSHYSFPSRASPIHF